MGAPAGWYPTPDGELRYWDGSGWTSHVAPAHTGTRPPAGPNPAPPTGRPSLDVGPAGRVSVPRVVRVGRAGGGGIARGAQQRCQRLVHPHRGLPVRGGGHRPGPRAGAVGQAPKPCRGRRRRGRRAGAHRGGRGHRHTDRPDTARRAFGDPVGGAHHVFEPHALALCLADGVTRCDTVTDGDALTDRRRRPGRRRPRRPLRGAPPWPRSPS